LRVEQLLKLERDPFTLNHYLWDTINNARLAKFEKTLDKAMDASKHPTSPDFCNNKTLRTQMVSWFHEDCGIGGTNTVQEAEEMIAIVHAYWKTATKRYIDNVCNVIDEELCKGTKECLYGDPDQSQHRLLGSIIRRRRKNGFASQVANVEAGPAHFSQTDSP
jgi:Na+-translocating ferredoxin:NAD+ oxidoreductase RNF subunit RnfB